MSLSPVLQCDGNITCFRGVGSPKREDAAKALNLVPIGRPGAGCHLPALSLRPTSQVHSNTSKRLLPYFRNFQESHFYILIQQVRPVVSVFP